MLLETTATFVSLLGGLIGLIAFGLGISRTARLRRREQLFREALGILPPAHGSYRTTQELHRAALAEIAARQLTSPWRTIFPWLVWVSTVALHVQAGYQICESLASGRDLSLTTLAEAAYGDWFTATIGFGVYFGVLPQVSESYVHALRSRAEAARAFYDGEVVKRPQSYAVASSAADVRRRGDVASHTRAAQQRRSNGRSWSRAILSLAIPITPGLFAVAIGLYLGLLYWSRQRNTQAASLQTLVAWSSMVFIAVSVLAVLAVLVSADVRGKLDRFSLPDRHPKSALLRSRSHRGTA